MTGLPFFSSTIVEIYIAPIYRTIPIKSENMGRLLKESPIIIIASKEGIPIRLTSVLEDLFTVIFASNQDKNLQGLHFLYQTD